MDALDRIPGIIGYATVRAEDGSVESVKGSSQTAIGDLTAYFSSAAEAIRANLDMGALGHISLVYGVNRLVIIAREERIIGIEIERDRDAQTLIRSLIEPETVTRPEAEVPRSLASKVHQINLLIDEFGGDADRSHWVDLLNQSLGVLGRDIAPSIGVVEGRLAFKQSPGREQEDDFVESLRSIVDFLVKKAVEEMGSSQARIKVQSVIERMK